MRRSGLEGAGQRLRPAATQHLSASFEVSSKTGVHQNGVMHNKDVLVLLVGRPGEPVANDPKGIDAAPVGVLPASSSKVGTCTLWVDEETIVARLLQRDSGRTRDAATSLRSSLPSSLLPSVKAL
jgi:hypothetical protein